MVLQVLPDPGQVGHHVEAQGTQLVGRADAGQQQQLRRADRARADDHLAEGVRLGQFPVAQVADAGTAAVPHQQPGDQAARLDGQVRAVPGRDQVGVGRADPLPAIDGQVDPGRPFVRRAAEVPGGRAADLGQGRGEHHCDRMPVPFRDGGDPDRARGATQRRVPAVGVLAAPEVRQQVRISPPGRPGRGPAVVDRAVAADVRHGVDRPGPAQDPAPGIGDRPASSSSTRAPGSSPSRAASTQPAVPAPTTM